MAGYTRLGQGLWDWEPFYQLSTTARCVWMCLYCSPLAKMCLPGLVRCTVVSLAEASRLGYSEVQSALTEMADRQVVEVDYKAYLMRLTRLPDRGERPTNGKALLSFWYKWEPLADAPIKYRWLETLEWLMHPQSADHSKVWADTFGQVSKAKSEPTYPQERPIQGVLGLEEPLSNDFKGDLYNTVLPRYGKGKGIGLVVGQEGEPEPRRPAQMPWEPEPPSRRYPAAPEAAPLPRSGPNGPSDGSLTVEDVLCALRRSSGGRVDTALDGRLGDRMWALVGECQAQGIGVQDIELAGEYLASGYLGYRDDLDVRWVAAPGNLISTVSKARTWEQSGRQSGGQRRDQDKGLTTAELIERARRLEAEGR